MPFANPVMAGKYLVRQVMQSLNFVTGVSGWQIAKNGSAQFNNITIRGGTVIGGTALYYNGPPAAGNLVASISSGAGTDGFGNAYVGGVASYGASGLSALSEGGVVFDSEGDTSIELIDGQITIASLSAALNVLVPVQSLITVEPGTTATAEAWHTATLENGWTGTAQYKALPDGNVALRTLGSLGAGTLASSTTILTLPSGWQPAEAQVIPCIISSVGTGSTATGASPYLQIGTNGAVDVVNISAQVATNIRFAGMFALDS